MYDFFCCGDCLEIMFLSYIAVLFLAFSVEKALVVSKSSFALSFRNKFKLYDSPNDSTEHMISDVRQAFLNQANLANKVFCAGVVTAFSEIKAVKAETASKIILPTLPYPYTALEPYVSARTLQYHHDKHHAKYVATTQSMIAGTELEKADLTTIMRRSYGINAALFNNAAQSWNHAFYWKCMRPSGGGIIPEGKLRAKLEETFGSIQEFRNQFASAGNTNFGSGWAWLVKTADGRLEVIKTSGANNPLIDGKIPILTMDVWEHAYYLDYQNERNRYVDAFLDKLVDWRFVAEQYSRSQPLSM